MHGNMVTSYIDQLPLHALCSQEWIKLIGGTCWDTTGSLAISSFSHWVSILHFQLMLQRCSLQSLSSLSSWL